VVPALGHVLAQARHHVGLAVRGQRVRQLGAAQRHTAGQLEQRQRLRVLAVAQTQLSGLALDGGLARAGLGLALLEVRAADLVAVAALLRALLDALLAAATAAPLELGLQLERLRLGLPLGLRLPLGLGLLGLGPGLELRLRLRHLEHRIEHEQIDPKKQKLNPDHHSLTNGLPFLLLFETLAILFHQKRHKCLLF